jgi:peptidoglycan hydrolase-like protein with peptidoglycan-binding domain
MALQKKGFNPGEADGVLGPRTRKALTAFQQQQRLQANGQLDNQTLAALGMSEGAGSSTSGQNNALTQ